MISHQSNIFMNSNTVFIYKDTQLSSVEQSTQKFKIWTQFKFGLYSNLDSIKSRICRIGLYSNLDCVQVMLLFKTYGISIATF